MQPVGALLAVTLTVCAVDDTGRPILLPLPPFRAFAPRPIAPDALFGCGSPAMRSPARCRRTLALLHDRVPQLLRSAAAPSIDRTLASTALMNTPTGLVPC